MPAARNKRKQINDLMMNITSIQQPEIKTAFIRLKTLNFFVIAVYANNMRILQIHSTKPQHAFNTQPICELKTTINYLRHIR